MKTSQCKTSATIKNFQNQFDEKLSDVQEIFFEANDGKIFSFLVKWENLWKFFWEYAILKNFELPKIWETIFFMKNFENARIVNFLTEEKFLSSEMKNCDEKNFWNIFMIFLWMLIILFFLWKFFYKK